MRDSSCCQGTTTDPNVEHAINHMKMYGISYQVIELVFLVQKIKCHLEMSHLENLRYFQKLNALKKINLLEIKDNDRHSIHVDAI